MATAEQLKALMRSYSEGDGTHFVSVALQIAAHAARSGKSELAQELRALVDEIKSRQATGKIGGAVPIARPTGELAGLLAVTYPKTQLAEMVLSQSTADQLKRVVTEYRNQSKLREHGLSARRKLLLVGPPGTGKTMTAAALAGATKLPLFTVQLHGLITKFMGETAAKLHLIFEAMRKVHGVYFFDEFDAIGAHRGSGNDVGEIRRVLNSFLQFLEQDDSDSLILAATNFVELLDEALFRRFDDVIEYERPSGTEAEALIRNRLQLFLGKRNDWKRIQVAAAGLSHAEIARSCNDAAKECILREEGRVTTASLIRVLTARRRTEKVEGSVGDQVGK